MSWFKCPIFEEIENKKYAEDSTCDKYMKEYFWHEENCTCFIMQHYSHFWVEQDAHIRTWLETRKLLQVRFGDDIGVTYYFFDDFVNNFLNEDVRRYLNYYKKDNELWLPRDNGRKTKK